ncbi:MAG: bifunctional hydroxymethylpyrimidine kinase/phosphomethylpyrimidine kinase [Rhodobacter sp.]|nr:bifunctional hydroxymethylpyrimidine kinase/phosphomethylpyrimidine kinase [Rhodobacter sp.]
MVAKALTIAGSDSGGGAGIQADLKTFSALGVFGCSVITAVTAQNTSAVTAVHAVPPDVVVAQIDAVFSDIDIDAVKVGMLGDPDLIGAVTDALSPFGGPIILDPVMVSKSGARLLSEGAVSALRDRLLPKSTVVTPNVPEAAALLDTREATSDAELRAQGRRILSLGTQAVLVKGGHRAAPVCTDWLIAEDGETSFAGDRIETRNTHGTGCSYSSAIAAGLAKGQCLKDAIQTAHLWLHQAISEADGLGVGGGHGPVHHFHGIWT